ncbi:hypothetical protein MHY1_02941 [Methylovirgula sp. HY1]|nr:hypothetical protein MHY1_02941 [Methylovirgula sp. HY1]
MTEVFSGVQGRGGSADPGARCFRGPGVRDLDVHVNVLRKWVKEFSAEPAQAFPGQGQMKAEQVKITRLRREVSKLKAERNIQKNHPGPIARVCAIEAGMLLQYAVAHIQHMQKALMEMNLQLHHVVSDITGATGMRIIRAIVAGERNPDVLATYRDVHCHSSIETIRAALVGTTGTNMFSL